MSVWVSSSASSGDEERPRDGWGEQTRGLARRSNSADWRQNCASSWATLVASASEPSAGWPGASAVRRRRALARGHEGGRPWGEWAELQQFSSGACEVGHHECFELPTVSEGDSED